jgi:MFS family permease
MPIEAVAVLFAIAGFFSGAVSPSRDMLIRSLTPPSEIGKVFGFVSTGFNIGGMVAPLVFGYVLDNSEAGNVFWIVAVVSLLSVLTVITTGEQRRRGI